MEKVKYHNIEFLRFVFSIIIVYLHILHSNILPYIGMNNDYLVLRELSRNAAYIVECFFIISGYFLYKNLNDSNNISITKFILKKIARLGPVLIFSCIIGVIFFHQSIYPALFNSLFLQCIGLSLDYRGINWYISPLFWALIFYYSLFKLFDNKKLYIFVGCICYVFYLANINYCDGRFARETVYGIINLGLARALAGIGLGILIGKGIDEFNGITFRINKKIKFLIISFIEISSTIFLIKYFLLGLKYKNAFIVVIIFSILFICFINQCGALSKLLNLRIFSKLGKYSYSIYVMQQISFWIMQKSLWKMSIINNTVMCIIISLFFSIFLGIITYYIIEKSFYNFLLNRNVN